MRRDEVTHAADVQLLIHSKIVDVAGIDTRVYTLPREVSTITSGSVEKSAEVILVGRNEPMERLEDSQNQ
jgi:hypothetical protein